MACFDLLNVAANNILARTQPAQGDLIRHNAVIERMQVQLPSGRDPNLEKPWAYTQPMQKFALTHARTHARTHAHTHTTGNTHTHTTTVCE